MAAKKSSSIWFQLVADEFSRRSYISRSGEQYGLVRSTALGLSEETCGAGAMRDLGAPCGGFDAVEPERDRSGLVDVTVLEGCGERSLVLRPDVSSVRYAN